MATKPSRDMRPRVEAGSSVSSTTSASVGSARLEASESETTSNVKTLGGFGRGAPDSFSGEREESVSSDGKRRLGRCDSN